MVILSINKGQGVKKIMNELIIEIRKQIDKAIKKCDKIENLSNVIYDNFISCNTEEKIIDAMQNNIAIVIASLDTINKCCDILEDNNNDEDF